MAKSYHQACALALALDRIGERWTLLIVRELLTGPKRFRDLQAGLHGIASNLLADRLRRLEGDGLVERVTITQPDGVEGYGLTPRGAALEPAVAALIRWGGADLPQAPPEALALPHWLSVAVPALLRPPDDLAFSANLDVDGVPLSLAVDGGSLRVATGWISRADLEIGGGYRAVLALFAGAAKAGALERKGSLRIRGGRAARQCLRRLLRGAGTIDHGAPRTGAATPRS